MLTRWGETLDKQQVLQEYPRPQLVREKIELSPSEPRYVHTKWGVGYYFNDKLSHGQNA